jgi:hypothetical protein
MIFDKFHSKKETSSVEEVSFALRLRIQARIVLFRYRLEFVKGVRY